MLRIEATTLSDVHLTFIFTEINLGMTLADVAETAYNNESLGARRTRTGKSGNGILNRAAILR